MNEVSLALPLLQAEPGGPGQLITTFVTFGLVFVIFYFLIIRPQNKKQKEQKAMLDALKKGDKVVTIGGIRGVVQSIKEDTLKVKVDTNTVLEMSRSAVSSVVDKSSSAKKKKEEKEPAEEADEASESSESENNES
jgi:preprotein translocase subunit YajC